MSMSFPFFFDPVTLYRDGRPHLIVDGGVLSNFPVWLFDSPDPIKRRTWGFRLHQGAGPEQPPYHEVPPAAVADPARQGDLRLDDRGLGRADVGGQHGPHREHPDRLREDARLRPRARRIATTSTGSGYETARDFFRAQPEYMNSYGRRG